MAEVCHQSAVSIQSQMEKALKLVKLSALNKGHLEHVELAHAVDEYLQEHRDSLCQKGLVCENGIDPECIVVAVPDQMKELFSNLLANAVRYSLPGGVIRIGSERTGDVVTVAVHDDGIGIVSSDLERIFDEFYKADTSRHDLDSPGLGLALCKKIISNHNGVIRAESPGIGCGTTVRFTLPLQ